MITRRVFIRAISGALLGAPLTIEGQTGRAWRVGYLTSTGSDARQTGLTAFRQRLTELGYADGQTLTLEIRSTERPEQFPALAAELVRLKVDVIVASSVAAIGPSQKATSSIPIVMVIAPDPVASGFVASLARPGGNITGLTSQNSEVAGKRLQLLKEAVPNLSRVAFLWESPGGAATRRSLSEVEAAATMLRLQVQAREVQSPSELDDAFIAATRGRADAAIMAGPMSYSHRHQIAQLAVKHRLPIVGPSADYAEAGWLMSYGPSYADQARRAAEFVDRILKGAKPADLPVEQPTKFHLSINLKTSKALGLNMPRQLLQRADQVFEQ